MIRERHCLPLAHDDRVQRLDAYLCTYRMPSMSFEGEPRKDAWTLKVDPASTVECGLYDISGLAERGDHVAVRSVDKGTLDASWHHGIYQGESRVVHMRTAPGVKRISEVSLAEFIGTGLANDTYLDRAAIIAYEDDTPEFKATSSVIAAAATTEAAMSQGGGMFQGGCDGFAVWCRTGTCDDVAVTAELLASIPVSDPVLHQRQRCKL